MPDSLNVGCILVGCILCIALTNPPLVTPSSVPCSQPLLEESLQQYFGDDTTPAHLKLADVPGDDTTRLIACAADAGTVGPFPLVAVRNVFVLPGVYLWEGCTPLSASG
jgi:hypothetical protein